MKNELASETIEELLDRYSDVTAELHKRKISSESHDLFGGYSQLLICKALGLLPAPAGSRGFDATDANKRRYLIRGCRESKEGAAPELVTVRDLGNLDFDFLVGVLFDARLKVNSAVQIPVATVKTEVAFLRLAMTEKFALRKALLQTPAVADITDDIHKAENIVLQRPGKTAKKALAKAAARR